MDNPFKKRRKPDNIEETIKKLAAGHVTLEELANPNPLYIVFVIGEKYQVGMGKSKVVYNSKEELETFADKQPNDAKLICFVPAPGCEPLPDPAEILKHDSRQIAAHTIEPVIEAELTDLQKKARWWNRFGNKGNKDKKKKKIKTSHIPVIVPDEVSTYANDHAIAGFDETKQGMNSKGYWELEYQKRTMKELNYPTNFNTSEYGIQGF